MHNQIREFIEQFNPLFKRGLPLFWEEKGGMCSQKEYNDTLINCRFDHRKFDDMQHQYLSRKVVIDKLAGYFNMMFEFKATCTKFPIFSYSENIELMVLAKEMINLDLRVVDQWKIIENDGKIKYNLRQ